MFDLTGVAGRATVYGWVTALLVIVFAFFDAYTTHYVVTSGAALGTLIAVALALALTFHLANRRLTPLLIDSLYKKSRFGRVILERAAAAVAHATDETAISAGMFVKKAATGRLEELPETVVRNDPLVLSLMAEQKPLMLPLLARTSLRDEGAAVLAVPVALRSELLGFALYWPRKNGTPLDRDDEESLTPIVANAAVAWQHLRIVALQARLDVMEKVGIDTEAGLTGGERA